MVAYLPVILLDRGATLLAQVPPAAERGAPVTWVKLIASLVLLTVGGVALVVLAWLAMRTGRRHLRRVDSAYRFPRDARGRIDPDDWSRKPLVQPSDEDSGSRN